MATKGGDVAMRPGMGRGLGQRPKSKAEVWTRRTNLNLAGEDLVGRGRIVVQ